MRPPAAICLLASALAVAVTGCSDPLGSRGARMPGVIEWVRSESTSAAALSVAPPHHVERIVAPDTVAAGVFFDATVTTVGANGCWSSDGAEVQLAPMVAEVRPHDRNGRGSNMACTMALVDLPRTVRLRFAEAGEATIRVHGRRVVDGDFQGATEGTIEKRVVVR
jgi:hypothetical protein